MTVKVDIESELKQSYLDYAMSVIVESAIQGRPKRQKRKCLPTAYYLYLSKIFSDEIVKKISAERVLTPVEERKIRALLRLLRFVISLVTHYIDEKSESINRLLRSSGRGLRSPPDLCGRLSI